MTKITTNNLFYGDNLDILRRYIDDESMDLVYLDPPFKSGKDYNILFEEKNGTASKAQIQAFEDSWNWDQYAVETYSEIIEKCSEKVVKTIKGFYEILGNNDMMAYLVMMAIRLVELHRVLKDTGVIYLHCDPAASHYLKILMDSIFDKKNFRNEIIWHYRKWPSGFKQFQRNHDIILFYSKTDTERRIFNIDYMERAESTLKRFGTAKIISGYDEKGRRIPSQIAGEESKGVPRDDVWDIGRVPPIKQLFPTQKPEELLERIIKTSSKEGDIILDPFCGCGTTIIAAQSFRRQWIGIDITHLAITLIKHRLRGSFGNKIRYQVIGEPKDLSGARELANQNKFQFQCWALGLVGARPRGIEDKKGRDRGIDGYLFFRDSNDPADIKEIIIQVKGGEHISPSQVRDLHGVLGRENAAIGVFITLEQPTKEMKKEAASVEFYKSPLGTKHHKIQILTIEELLAGKEIDCPKGAVNETLKKSQRVKDSSEEQTEMI